VSDFDKNDRALLDLARDAAEPTSADRARVRAALAARLGAAAGLGTAAGLGASAKAAAAAGAGGGGSGATAAGVAVKGGLLATTKLIGTAILVSAGVAGGAVAVHHARRAPVAAIVAAPQAQGRVASPRRSAPAVADVAPSLPDPPEAPSEPVPEARERADISRRGVALPLRPSSPAPRAAIRDVRAAERSPTASPPEAPPAAEHREAEAPQPPLPAAREHVDRPTQPIAPTARSSLADEARLVREGVAAMRAGNPARAVVLFDAHARAYPHGVLAVEREAERALALAELDRPAVARAALAEFLRAHPDSPLIATVRQRLRALDAAGAGATSGQPPR